MSRTIRKSKGEELFDEIMDDNKSKTSGRTRTYSKIRKKGYKPNDFKGRKYKVSTPSK